ncbi:hypothetical protein MPSEU_001025400 [Mayamaea pseudoterrestris]|nr:hypothetical protein MPSEU_001025400 [Mayamaea pseudoterrestris]
MKVTGHTYSTRARSKKPIPAAAAAPTAADVAAKSKPAAKTLVASTIAALVSKSTPVAAAAMSVKVTSKKSFAASSTIDAVTLENATKATNPPFTGRQTRNKAVKMAPSAFGSVAESKSKAAAAKVETLEPIKESFALDDGVKMGAAKMGAADCKTPATNNRKTFTMMSGGKAVILGAEEEVGGTIKAGKVETLETAMESMTFNDVSHTGQETLAPAGPTTRNLIKEMEIFCTLAAAKESGAITMNSFYFVAKSLLDEANPTAESTTYFLADPAVTPDMFVSAVSALIHPSENLNAGGGN